MRIKIVLAAAILCLFSLAIYADAADVKAPIKSYPALTGSEPTPPNATISYAPTPPGLAIVSPGDTVGWTQYDYQCNASSGNRVAVDNQGNVHFTWMKGAPYPTTRHMYYNCYSPTGWAFPGTGTAVSYRSGAGYGFRVSSPSAL